MLLADGWLPASVKQTAHVTESGVATSFQARGVPADASGCIMVGRAGCSEK